MKYIYDIVLNFQSEFIDFYEWNKSDICEYINKIRLYLVSNKDYLNLKYHDCTIENKLPSIFLVTNGLEVIGLRFNKQGKILKRSSLLFEEANDIITKLPNLKRLVIKYKSLKIKNITYEGRTEKEKKKYLHNFLDTKRKDEYLLKYIYFELTNKEANNRKEIEKALTDCKNIDKLYEIISNIKKV